jgi:hypothetical protein
MGGFFQGYVLGAATSKVVEIAIDRGARWLDDYFRDHGDEVREQASANSAEFLSRLSNRVDDLEERGMQLDQQLSHPDFAAALKTAMIAAARSSDGARHETLAHLVATRLDSPSESDEAVLSTVAIETLPRLSLQHIHFFAHIYAFQWPCGFVMRYDDSPAQQTSDYEKCLTRDLEASPGPRLAGG